MPAPTRPVPGPPDGQPDVQDGAGQIRGQVYVRGPNTGDRTTIITRGPRPESPGVSTANERLSRDAGEGKPVIGVVVGPPKVSVVHPVPIRPGLTNTLTKGGAGVVLRPTRRFQKIPGRRDSGDNGLPW